MNILIYTNFNGRSICIESTVLYFKKNENVKLLTTVERGEIHNILEQKEVSCYAAPKSSHFKQVIFLYRFIKKHKIDVVHAHLQLPSFYASLLHKFYRFRLFTVRHNSDVIYIDGSKKEIYIERIINRLSPQIIAISDVVKEQLTKNEKVFAKKIKRINNGYDFKLLNELSDNEHLSKLKVRYKNQFIVLMPGRFIDAKRHELAIELVKQLKNKIPHLHLIFIGNGLKKHSITNSIIQHGLDKHISILDYTTYISDFYKISDLVIQISISEASNNVIKEALFYDKPVFACKKVGDFEDYLHEELLLDKQDPLEQLEEKIVSLSKDQNYYKLQVAQSKTKMISRFDIQNVGKAYDKIHQKVK